MTALIAAVLVFANRGDGALTYTCRAKAVGSVLSDISQATGLHLEADPEANREIVLVSVEHEPIEIVLDGIAKATSCTWRVTPTRRVLIADPAQRGQEAESEFVELTRGIAQGIKDSLEAFDAPRETDGPTPDQLKGMSPEDVAKLRELAAQPDPGDLAIHLILRSIDPGDLASIGLGERVVWASNSPTGTQRAMPEGCGALIQDWIGARNAAARLLRGISFGIGTTEEMSHGEREAMRQILIPITKAPAKALLTVTSDGIGGVQAQLNVYDRQGSVLVHTECEVSRGDAPGSDRPGDASSVPGQPVGAPPKQSPPKPQTQIRFSEDSKLWRAGLRRIRTVTATFAANPEFKGRVFHPETHDPLSFVATDELLALAAYRHKPLIADIPDSFFAFAGISSVENLEKVLDAGRTFQVAGGDALLILKPALPAKQRAERVDRTALRKLLAAVDSGPQPFLAPLSTYALLDPPPFADPVGQSYLLILPKLHGSMPPMDIGGWNLCRLYGTLDQSQWEKLESGRAVPFSELSSEQSRLVAAILFGEGATFRAAQAKRAGSRFDLLSQMTEATAPRNADFEPTELMPAGLPANGSLTCDVVDEPIFQTSTNWMCYSASALAETDADPSGLPSSLAFVEGFMGTRSNLEFTFHVGSNAVLDGELFADQVPADGKRIRIDELPAFFQTLVKQRKAELLKQMQPGYFDSGYGGSEPPP